MIPVKKEDLRKLVTDTTVEIYEELTPQLVKLIQDTKKNTELTEGQKQDEISLHMMGYVKSCTNEIPSYRFCQRFWDLKTRMKSKIVLVRYKCDLSEKEKILIRKTELLLDNTEMIKNMKQQLRMVKKLS